MKLILVGRSGSGKTSVVESLLGSSPILPKTYMHEITRLSSPVTVAETVGFFSKNHDLQACTKKLTESVHSFAPGPDAFGLVIKIGRFTQEEKQMVDIFRKTYGEGVFHFTILIFTRLDDLLYDHVPLDEFLEDSTPELKEILDLCSGRYIGFDNSGSWEARTGYAQSLVSIIKMTKMKNNNGVYTTDLLDKANALNMKKTGDELRRKEESNRQMKEVIKASMRPELQEQIRQDINEKFEIEEQQRKMRAHTFPEDRNLLKHQGNEMTLILIGRSGSGKTSVMESLTGYTIPARSTSVTVTRFGGTLNIAETFGFFSKKHDINACSKSLTDRVRSCHSGPDVFGLVIRIGRYTQEEKKMVEIFRDTFGDDVFQFTILLFTGLDDLRYDNVALDEFLADCTPEQKDVLDLCERRYLGFDNSGSWEERNVYAESLVSRMKTMQVKNKNIYTVDMLDKAMGRKLKKNEEELKLDEERRIKRKEELKAVLTLEKGQQMRKEIDEKLRKEEQERIMMAKEGKTSTETKYLQGPHTSDRPRGPIVYTKIRSQSDTTKANTEQKPVSSPKKEKNKQKVKGPKPELKPKPKHTKSEKSDKEGRKNSYPGQDERSSSVSETTPAAAERGAARPRRTGFMGKLIDFFDGLLWVCAKCYELNGTDNACCKKCEDPKIKGATSTVEKSAPRCPQCNEVKDSPQDACVSCSKREKKVARVNPVPKPSRTGIESKEIRIVLIGKTGAGKSATANTILNEERFKAKACLKSVTEKCQYHRKERWGQLIMIVDTPGLFDTSVPKDVISTEIKKCITISAPGPHAFLLIVSLANRFTQEEKDVLKELDNMFGEHMMKYLIVAFTGRDRIENDSIKEYIEDSPEELRSVLKAAGGGFLTFNNRGKDVEKEEDAQNLYDRMTEMVKQNGGSHFTSEMFQEAEEIMQSRITRELEEMKEELRREVEQELRKEMEEVMRKEREYFQKLHEANVGHMEKMKLELKSEREKKFIPGRKKEKALGELVHQEMKTTEKKNKIIQQIAKTEGADRVRMQHQLADVGDEIKKLVVKRKNVEEEVTGERMSAAFDMTSKAIREEERKKIEGEDQNTLGRFVDGIKHLGSRFMNLFR